MFMIWIFPCFKVYLWNSSPRCVCLRVGWCVQFPRAAVRAYHPLSDLKQNLLSHSLESRIRISVEWAWGRIFSFPLSSLLIVVGNFWHSLAYAYVTAVCVSVFTWCFLCIFHVLFVGQQSLHFGPTLLQYDLVLTNYICHDPISKKGHILSY